MFEALKDVILIILLVAAAVSIGLAFMDHDQSMKILNYIISAKCSAIFGCHVGGRLSGID